MSDTAPGSPRRPESPAALVAEGSAPATRTTTGTAAAAAHAPASAPTSPVRSTTTTPIASTTSAPAASTTPSPPPELTFARQPVHWALGPRRSELTQQLRIRAFAARAVFNHSGPAIYPVVQAPPIPPPTAPATASPQLSGWSTVVASQASQTEEVNEALLSPNATVAPIPIPGAVPRPRKRQNPGDFDEEPSVPGHWSPRR